jgi:hypothetical protein
MENCIKELDGVEFKGRKIFFKKDHQHNDDLRRESGRERSRSPAKRDFDE